MREELQNINGIRKEFKGTFVKFGQKTNFKGYIEKTILMQDVECTLDKRIHCDHLWFNLTKGFDIGLQEGDIIIFQARVKEYYKGYKGYREDIELKPIEKDYKLSHPTKIKLIIKK